jgi:hypothetical protein
VCLTHSQVSTTENTYSHGNYSGTDIATKGPEDLGGGDGMNKQQRIVIWVVAAVLSLVSLVNGVIGSLQLFAYIRDTQSFSFWEDLYYSFRWQRDSIFWYVVLPVLLLGVATFFHYAKRKD